MLPAPLARAVTVAYLVCRVADTIEDDSTVVPTRRRALLASWRAALDDALSTPIDVSGVGRTDDERRLMASVGAVHRELHRLSGADRAVIARYAAEMIDGMAESLAPGIDAAAPLFTTIAELERYCYFVAGTVGLMLTELYRHHAPSIHGARLEHLRDDSVAFGLGLQFTNVIRDVANDLAEGRVYFPAEHWNAARMTPDRFFAPHDVAASWSVVRPLLARAGELLDRALAYSVTVPRRAARIRLFCVVQLFFAERTLALVRRNAVLGVASTTVKMPRREVYLLLALAIAMLPSNTLLAAVHRRLRAAWPIT